ncbi:MAG: hypothetical protein ACEY3M_05690 [Wolbachia sp.]
MVNLVELCKNLERKIAKLYQFSLLVNQISDIAELFIALLIIVGTNHKKAESTA